MTEMATKLKTISCVDVDYNMMNKLTNSTAEVIIAYKKPMKKAFL